MHKGSYIRQAQKAIKVFIISLLLLVFLLGLMVHKALMFMSIAQLNRSHAVTCMGHDSRNNTHSRAPGICLAHQTGTKLNPESIYCDGVQGLDSMSAGPDMPSCPSVHMRWLWCIILLMVIPYLCIIVRDIWLVCVKNEPSPRRDVSFASMSMDTINTVGLCLLVFRVLPSLGTTFKGMAVLPGLSIVPSVVCMLKSHGDAPTPTTIKNGLLACVNICAFLAQLTCLFLWPVQRLFTHPHEGFHFEQPLSILMVSIGWWKNYAHSNRHSNYPGQKYHRCNQSPTQENLMQLVRQSDVKLALAGSIWKIFLTILMAVMLHLNDYSFSDWSSFMDNALDCGYIGDGRLGQYSGILPMADWVLVLAIGTILTVAVHFLISVAAKLHIQAATISLATLLVTPLTITTMMLACNHWTNDVCAFYEVRPLHLFWSCGRGGTRDFLISDYGWLSVFWWASQAWVSRHMWASTSTQCAKGKALFTNSLFDAIILDYWIVHHLRSKRYEHMAERERTSPEPMETDDVVPMIYMCATMWHENRVEMMAILKSLFGCDLEQFKRKLLKDTLMASSMDYFEFEAHIFFDDAMTPYELSTDDYTVNHFVKVLVSILDDAASEVHGGRVHVEGPTRSLTPYGGRLEWKMPGENKLTVHLKDKKKIRHKKRWSQVMYMNYFLKFARANTMLEELSREPPSPENTFILTLDGDVAFKPEALDSLVQVMRNNQEVGSVCGRMHPLGRGPVVWYQKFEYALTHWLLKSTEDVLGGVQCSPGCFSLLRGSALMNPEVACAFAALPTEARHYVQHDLGEDRWLTTLLLQQGYKVVYCAASEASTFVPDTICDFFTQRRRWIPSTMANIIDLLATWRATRSHNNISLLYIVYQAVLLVVSLLISGIIFLGVVWTVTIVTEGAVSLNESFVLNIIPLAVFTIMCHACQSQVQIYAAAVISIPYMLLQILGLVAIITETSNGGLGPSHVFFCLVCGSFLLAAALHPRECLSLGHGLLAFLAIPSVFVLLMVYAMANLHVISWGTREENLEKTQSEGGNKKRELEETKLAGAKATSVSSLECAQPICCLESFSLSVGNRCRCCRVDGYQRLENTSEEIGINLCEGLGDCEFGRVKDTSGAVRVLPKNSAETSPKQGWINDPIFVSGDKSSLPEDEETFFKHLIAGSLQPLARNREHESKVERQLVELRNKMSGAYLSLNTILIAIVYTVHLSVDTMHTSLYWERYTDIGGTTFEVTALIFKAIFGILLILQVWGMLFHRIATVKCFLAIPCEKENRGYKRLQDTHRDTLIDCLLCKEVRGNAALQDEEINTHQIKVTSSSEIAAHYRQKLHNSIQGLWGVPEPRAARTTSHMADRPGQGFCIIDVD